MNRLSSLPEDMIYEIMARTPVSDWESQLELIDFTFDINRLIGMTGRTVEQVFTEAVEEGASTIVQLLLEETNIDPTTLAINPLITAAANCHARIVTLLLEDGRVNPNLEDNYALRQAVSEGCLPVVDALLSDPRTIPDIQALYNAVDNNHVEVVQYLLDDGRFDPTNEEQNIIIHASDVGHAEVVRVLLRDERVDPTARDNEALVLASASGHTDVIRALVEDGRINPGTPNNEPIETAMINRQSEAVSYLLEQEQVLDQDLSSLLMHAIQYNFPEVARVVIRVQPLTEQQLRDAAVAVVERRNWVIGELLSPLL